MVFSAICRRDGRERRNPPLRPQSSFTFALRARPTRQGKSNRKRLCPSITSGSRSLIIAVSCLSASCSAFSGWRQHFQLHPFQLFERQPLEQGPPSSAEVMLHRIAQREKIAARFL